MSDIKKDETLKPLSKESLRQQIKESEVVIKDWQDKIVGLQQQVQQQLGVMGYAQYLLKQFDIPEASKPEAPKPVDIEVK